MTTAISKPKAGQTAISYIRFPTMTQANGDSIRRQTKETEVYCEKHGLTLTDR